MIKIDNLNKKYTIRRLDDKDIDIIFDLYKDNDLYFSHLHTDLNKQTIIDDMNDLPKGKQNEDKYFIGYFLNNELLVVIDLIDGYPEDKTVYVGLFMLKKKYQNRGIGASIVDELKISLKDQGFKKIKLSYVNTNPQARHFWHKMRFVEDGKTATFLGNDITELECAL